MPRPARNSSTFKEHSGWSAAGLQSRTASAWPSGRVTDDTVKVWDAQTGQELLTLKGHTAAVMSVAFSPDGKRLATRWLRDRTVKVWDAQTGQEALTLKGHTAHVRSVAFSPDGKRLAGAVWTEQDGEGVGCPDRPGTPHAQGAHGRGLQRGLQPRRQAPGLGQWPVDREASNPAR